MPDDVPTIFQKPSTIAVDNIQCGCYDYKAWTSDGIITSHRHNTILCKSRKLTSFLALIGLGNVEPILGHPIVLSTTMELTLDVISIVGCSLSLLGLLLIWLTALFCRQWRSQLSNRFLLNICFVLTLIMTYFLFINIPDWHNALVNLEFCNSCMAEGAFLQYIILVLFLWMFSTALLQYQRYVTVIGNKRPSHFIAKCALFAWGLPLIPTALVIYFDPESYMPFTTNGPICYPTGLSLYLAVLTPISTVVSINIGIFVYILYKVRISLRNNDAYHACKDTKVQLRLSLLLFFLLGISWVFGILAHIYQNIIFSLCFCLTSTLQGFILCVYFVILDRSVRYLWLKYCCGRNYKSIDNTISMSPLPSNSNHKKLYESD